MNVFIRNDYCKDLFRQMRSLSYNIGNDNIFHGFDLKSFKYFISIKSRKSTSTGCWFTREIAHKLSKNVLYNFRIQNLLTKLKTFIL